MNTTNNPVEVLRSTLEKVLRQNECEMMLTGDEIRAARKVLAATERAATQPAGERLPCPKCVGTITKADDPCAYCGGVGYCGPVIEAPPAPVQAAPDARDPNQVQTIRERLTNAPAVQAAPVGAQHVPTEYTDYQLARGICALKSIRERLGEAASDDSICGVIYDAMCAAAHVETQPGAPNYDGADAFEAHQATTAVPLTIGEAFKAVGGWMNGGELGYPSFGSMDALRIYTQKMIRSVLTTPTAPERTSEAGELPPKRGDCTDECDYQQKLQGYRARQSPPTVTGTSDEKPSDPIRHIITGVREFYLGMLSKHLPMEAFDVARSDDATMVAYQGVAQLFLELVDSVIDARSPVAAAPDLSARDAALEEAYRAADAIMPLDNECNHRDPVKVRNDILNAINRLIGKPRAAPESAEPSAVQDAEDAARVMEMELALYRDVYGAKAPSEALVDVIDERQRQIDTKGWTPQHDDEHPCGEIAAFAAVYAMPPAARDWLCVAHMGYGDTLGEALCPEDWAPKFGDRRRELVKASALIIAEIERLDRATSSAAKGASNV